jgi:hypothetical protein
VKTDLELTGLFKLGHITLALERTARRQEDILMVTIDVLSPRRKPRNGILMNDLFPLAGDIGNGNGCVSSYVDGDILRINTQLGRVSKSSQPRRGRVGNQL